MLTRRGFAARIGIAAAAGRMLPEMAYAQRAAVNGAGLPSDVVWLNANEYPGGIPDVSLAVMREALPGAFRYHYQEFGAIYTAIAKSEDLASEQIVTGCGSSEGRRRATASVRSARSLGSPSASGAESVGSNARRTEPGVW